MKTLRFIPLACIAGLAFCTAALRAASNPAAWQAADDARVAAMTSANRAKLDATLSDDLRYVHSNGKLDTKASMIAALTSGKSVYHAMTYESRDFREVSPGLVLMNGRVNVLLEKNPPHTEMRLSFLAAYRLEHGTWRFIAWQSCKLEDAAAKK
jgi:hypothetical protein